jgi:hypothetical protein
MQLPGQSAGFPGNGQLVDPGAAQGAAGSCNGRYVQVRKKRSVSKSCGISRRDGLKQANYC